MKLIERLKTSSKWQGAGVGILWEAFEPVIMKTGMTPMTHLTILGLVGLAVLGQMIADWGKEAK